MHADSGDSTGAGRRSRNWTIIAGMLGGMLIGYAVLAYALYAALSAVF